MITRIKVPSGMEVRSVVYDQEKGEVCIEHRFLAGATTVNAFGITAEGGAGNKKEFAVMVNGSQGKYRLVEVADSPGKANFDMDPAAFKRLMAKRHEAGKILQQQKKQGKAGDPSVT